MSEKTFKTYEVSYHILNKAKAYAKTKEEAAELVSNMSEETLLDGSTLSIQHIWEPDVDLPVYDAVSEDLPATDEDFPLGSL